MYKVHVRDINILHTVLNRQGTHTFVDDAVVSDKTMTENAVFFNNDVFA